MNKHHKDKRRSLTEGGTVVTMLDDVNTAQHATRPGVYIAPRDVSQPAFVEGFYLPNRFRVEAAGVVAVLTVQAFTERGVVRFGCVSIELLPPEGAVEVVTVERLPVATWLRMAVKCARQLCRYYPANYVGPMLDHNGRPIVHVGASSGVRITEVFGTEEPAVLPIMRTPRAGYQWSDDAARALLGQQPRRQKSSWTDEFLREVADVYNGATSYKRDAVVRKWKCKSSRTADNWIRAAKEREFITPTKGKRAR